VIFGAAVSSRSRILRARYWDAPYLRSESEHV
jgi:hypothetical protein